MTVQQGELLAGRYKIVRPIGEGGAGVVYEALHEEIGKRVAIKFLHPERVLDETVTKRFLQEARAAAKIGHPSIVDIYDVGRTDDDTPFLVMELLEGESLREKIKVEGIFDVDFATYVAGQMLSALEAAHLAGIVHRDIKPENVFLVSSGQQRPAVKLLDFGVSRMVSHELEDTRLTRSNMVLGTPLYMSPEQAGGARDVDHLTDVYATGVVLYECLTGTPPFVAENLLALAAKIQSEDPHPPSSLRPNLPDGLEAVVLRAMTRHRNGRFQGAASFLEALLPHISAVDKALLSLPGSVTSPSLAAVRDRPSKQPAPRQNDSDNRTAPSSWPVGAGAPVTETLEGLEGKSKIEIAETLEATVRNGDSENNGLKGGRRLALVAALASVLISAVVIAAIALFPLSRNNGVEQIIVGASPPPPLEAGTEQVPDGEPEAEAGSSIAPDSSAAAITEASQSVEITLEGLPSGAEIRVDGRLIESDGEPQKTFSLPPEDRDVSVEVSASGYRTWRGMVSARESAERQVRLQRLRPLKQRRAGHKGLKTSSTSPRKLPAFGEGP